MIKEIFDHKKELELEEKLSQQKSQEAIEAQITQYFIDSSGAFLGAYSKNNPAIPREAIEVPLPPNHGISEYWDFKKSAWVEDPDLRLEILKDSLIEVRKKILKSTADYYAPDYPLDIIEQRAGIRKEIEAIKQAKTVKGLSKFS